LKPEDEFDEPIADSKKRKIEALPFLLFVQRVTLKKILSKCAAFDDFTASRMIKSEAIKGYVASKGYEMPRSKTKTWNLIQMF
jgi:hypothetical protein